MRNKRIFVLALVVFALSGSFGSQSFELDPYSTIETHLSSRDFNRIAIDGDRISQLFFDSSVFVVELDRENGQIFVKPVETKSKQPQSFAITTEKRMTQDFLFTCKDVKSRTLILKSRTKEGSAKSGSCQGKAQSLLAAMKDGANLNFVERTTKIPTTKAWKFKRLKYVKQGKLMGHVLTLKNVSEQPLTISINDLWRDTVAAMSVDKETLGVGEHTRVYMVTGLGGLL